MNMAKVGRNDPCPCGSGKKYKHCHWSQDQQQSSDEVIPQKKVQVIPNF